MPLHGSTTQIQHFELRAPHLRCIHRCLFTAPRLHAAVISGDAPFFVYQVTGDEEEDEKEEREVEGYSCVC